MGIAAHHPDSSLLQTLSGAQEGGAQESSPQLPAFPREALSAGAACKALSSACSSLLRWRETEPIPQPAGSPVINPTQRVARAGIGEAGKARLAWRGARATGPEGKAGASDPGDGSGTCTLCSWARSVCLQRSCRAACPQGSGVSREHREVKRSLPPCRVCLGGFVLQGAWPAPLQTAATRRCDGEQRSLLACALVDTEGISSPLQGWGTPAGAPLPGSLSPH